MTATVRIKPLAVSIAIPLAGGMASALLSGDMKDFYEALVLPPFAPPAWVFGVVWPILYLLMGIACYLVYEADASGAAKTQALTFYGVQLALNLLWSPLFFGLGNFRLAFWDLSAVLVLAIVTAACFFLVRKSAGWLLAPYLVWLFYAAALNRAVMALNGA